MIYFIYSCRSGMFCKQYYFICEVVSQYPWKLELHQSEIPLSSDGIIYFCQSYRTSERYISGKQRICLSSSWSAHFYVSWLSDFINYQKPLYKSLHQSFFYSFITILLSESGVTLHYSTILPQIILFPHLTSIFESTHVISRY